MILPPSIVATTTQKSHGCSENNQIKATEEMPPLGYEYMIYPGDEIAVLGFLEPAGYKNAVKVYESDGSNNINWKTFSDKNYLSLKLCDLDDDGKDDIVLLEEAEGIKLKVFYSSNTERTISISGSYWPKDIACGDFNGDLENEIAVLVGDWFDAQDLTILDRNGNILADRIKISDNLDILASWKNIAAGDVDGDIIDEIVAISKNVDNKGSSTVCVRNEILIEEDNDPISKNYYKFKADGKCIGVACGNLDGDSNGEEEIILSGHIGQYVDDYKIVSKAGETLIDWNTVPGNYGGYVSAGDFDKDGDEEIVIATSLGDIQIFDSPSLDDTPFENKNFHVNTGYGLSAVSCGDVDADGIKIKYIPGSKTTFDRDEYYPVALLYHPPCLNGYNSGEYTCTYTAYGHRYTTVNSDANSIGIKAETTVSFSSKLFSAFRINLRKRFKRYIEEKTEYGSILSHSTTYKTGSLKQPYVYLEKTIYDNYKYRFINGPHAGEDFSISLPSSIVSTSRSLSSYNKQRINAPKIVSEHVSGDPKSYLVKNTSGFYDKIQTGWFETPESPHYEEITLGNYQSKEFISREEASYTTGLSFFLGYDDTMPLISAKSHKITVGEFSTFAFQLDGLQSKYQEKWGYKYQMYLRRHPVYKYIIIDFFVDPSSLGSGYIDNEPPNVEITEPAKRNLYIFGVKIMPLPSSNNFDCVVIGTMDLEIQATDAQTGVQKVDVYFDGVKYPAQRLNDDGNTWTFPIINNNHYLPETHAYKAKAYDGVNNKAATEERKICSIMGNSPPFLYNEVSGPTSGKVGENYSFSTKLIDADGDDIYYRFDWGDDTKTEWIGAVSTTPITSASGGQESSKIPFTTITAEHKWKKQGTYTVSVEVKDSNDNHGLYNLTLDITLGRKSVNRPFVYLDNILKLGEPFKVLFLRLLANILRF